MSEQENSKKVPKPVVLCILDGWGARDEDDHNAIALAKTPHWDRLVASSPSARLDASEQEVGLPAGQMGNSEVGHMNLGAGCIVMQDLPRIDAAIAAGELEKIPNLRGFISALKETGGMRSWMAATRRRKAPRSISPNWWRRRGGRDGRNWSVSPLFQAAITRWIGTIAGNGSKKAGAPWCWGTPPPPMIP
jgi:hypothetical protein